MLACAACAGILIFPGQYRFSGQHTGLFPLAGAPALPLIRLLSAFLLFLGSLPAIGQQVSHPGSSEGLPSSIVVWRSVGALQRALFCREGGPERPRLYLPFPPRPFNDRQPRSSLRARLLPSKGVSLFSFHCCTMKPPLESSLSHQHIPTKC